MQNFTRKRRRSVIVSVSEQTLTFKTGSESSWCPGCAAQVHMIQPHEAAIIAAITPRRVYQWIEAGRLHYSEGPTGALLVCLNSLKFSSLRTESYCTSQEGGLA